MREHYYFRVFETDAILGRDVFMILGLEACMFFFFLSVAMKLGWASRIALCPCSSASTTSPKDYGPRECRIYGSPKQSLY